MTGPAGSAETSASTELAAAASHVHTLLCSGQGDLAGRDRDLVAAVQARDQLVTALVVTWRAMLPGQDRAEPTARALAVTAAEELQHNPVAATGVLLRRYPLTDVAGPAPTDLVLDPPTAPSARAWVQAARAVDRVAAHASREPLEPAQVDPSTGRWAMIGDLAALAGTVAVLDPDLADQVHGSPLPGLQRAGAVLHQARQHAQNLAAAADVVIRLARSGALPADYQVQVPGPASITTLAQVPAALDWARTAVGDGPPLTATQYRLFAGAVAVIAHHLAGVAAEPPAAAALADLAQVHHRFAESWHHWPLAATSAGDPRAVTQARQVAALVISSPEDTLTADLAALAAPRLVRLARTVQDNLYTAIADGAFLTPADTAGAWTPLPMVRALHRRVLGALTTLAEATDAATLAVGPVRPVTPTDETPHVAAATRLAPHLEMVRPVHPATIPARTGPNRPPPPIPGHAPGMVSRGPSR